MTLVEQLEQQIRDAKVLIEKRHQALRLSENSDFRKLFMEGYFRDDAARLVQLAGDPALTKEQQADSLSMAIATGHAKRYLSMAVQMGAHAEESLPDMERELELLRAEENEG